MIVIKTIENLLWIIVIIIIIINSVYFSFKLKFPQFNIKKMFKTLLDKEETTGLTSIDTLFMSLASKIGVGSLAGISLAIYYGGIGVLFWIFISSFFISINSYLENFLATIYKKKDGNFYKGGPAYYIKDGLRNKKLAITYAIILIFTYLFGFLTIQNNTITTLTNITCSIPSFLTSFFITIFASYFIFKGLKSISNLCKKLVPIMSIIYIIIGLIIAIVNYKYLGNFFIDIIKNAFTIKSVTGGIISIIIIGVKKSIFSSEAGLGTGAIISGATSCQNPEKEGYIGIIGTYFINLFISLITGLIIYFSNYLHTSFSNINGIELINYAFKYHLGNFGEAILLILILMFAFSTIITCYYYCESNFKIFSNSKIIIFILKIVTIVVIYFGGVMPSFIIWNIIDICLVILTVINIYSIYKLKDKII